MNHTKKTHFTFSNSDLNNSIRNFVFKLRYPERAPCQPFEHDCKQTVENEFKHEWYEKIFLFIIVMWSTTTSPSLSNNTRRRKPKESKTFHHNHFRRHIETWEEFLLRWFFPPCTLDIQLRSLSISHTPKSFFFFGFTIHSLDIICIAWTWTLRYLIGYMLTFIMGS